MRNPVYRYERLPYQPSIWSFCSEELLNVGGQFCRWSPNLHFAPETSTRQKATPRQEAAGRAQVTRAIRRQAVRESIRVP